MPGFSFLQYKQEFISRHNHCDWRVITSPMVDNTYTKTYVFADGAQPTEINSWVFQNNTRVFKTEAFNTDNPKSYVWYEA